MLLNSSASSASSLKKVSPVNSYEKIELNLIALITTLPVHQSCNPLNKRTCYIIQGKSHNAKEISFHFHICKSHSHAISKLAPPLPTSPTTRSLLYLYQERNEHIALSPPLQVHILFFLVSVLPLTILAALNGPEEEQQ